MNRGVFYSSEKTDGGNSFPLPVVKEIQLNRRYSFMYENFIVSTQHDLYLLVERSGEDLHALKFEFAIFRYGYPNDEVRGGHLLMKFGLRWYGFYQVENSPWVREIMVANRIHPMHRDEMFSQDKHFIVCFKDVMLEVICTKYEEVTIKESTLFEIIQKELSYLE
jgi:hypothetical protein